MRCMLSIPTSRPGLRRTTLRCVYYLDPDDVNANTNVLEGGHTIIVRNSSGALSWPDFGGRWGGLCREKMEEAGISSPEVCSWFLEALRCRIEAVSALGFAN